jgi:uncharacterized RDD family membrane protein YckC
MEPVGVAQRAVAVLIDSILLFIAGYAIAAASGQTTADGFEIRGGPFFLWLGIALAYYIAMEALRGGTLGKLATGLKVVKQDGQALDLQASVVRNVLRLVDGLFFYLVGAIVVWVSKGKQRLGDMAAHTKVVKARAWIALLIAVAAAGGLPVENAAAASPRYADLVLSDARDGPQKEVFAPDTPKVYLRTRLVDVPSGSVIKGVWIAEKTKVAPPNYAIDATEMKVGPLMNIANFNLSRPNAGWPEGDYRVDLFIGGKAAGNVRFKVKQ